MSERFRRIFLVPSPRIEPMMPGSTVSLTPMARRPLKSTMVTSPAFRVVMSIAAGSYQPSSNLHECPYHRGVRRRILLVEDDPKTRETVALYLRREGHEVVTADDGVRALEAAHEHEPHLVVLDLMLPRMDGLAVCRALRESPLRPGIIMVTARTTEQDKLTGLDLGADDYVTKPFSPRELMARVRAVLRRAAEEDVVEIAGITVDRILREVRVLDS